VLFRTIERPQVNRSRFGKYGEIQGTLRISRFIDLRKCKSSLEPEHRLAEVIDRWFVRLSRTAKRIARRVFAKSSSDTAVCRANQSDHDIFSNPFHNSALTTFHARRT